MMGKRHRPSDDRMYYSGDENVMAVLKDIFPETTSEFNRIIEAVIK